MKLFELSQKIEIWNLVKDLDQMNLSSRFGIFPNGISNFDSMT
jgi:hypothetical protein